MISAHSNFNLVENNKSKWRKQEKARIKPGLTATGYSG
jgi:hypothetical protein